jgi:hypothetical protein
MMTLGKLLAERDECKVPAGGEELVIGFKPNAFTGEFLDKLGEATVDEAILTLVTDWPLTYDDGSPVPLTAEGLKDVPVPFKQRVYRSVKENAFPN